MGSERKETSIKYTHGKESTLFKRLQHYSSSIYKENVSHYDDRHITHMTAACLFFSPFFWGRIFCVVTDWHRLEKVDNYRPLSLYIFVWFIETHLLHFASLFAIGNFLTLPNLVIKCKSTINREMPYCPGFSYVCVLSLSFCLHVWRTAINFFDETCVCFHSLLAFCLRNTMWRKQGMIYFPLSWKKNFLLPLSLSSSSFHTYL